MVKVTGAEIRHVPAQGIVPNFITFVPSPPPSGVQFRKRRQHIAVGGKQFFRLADNFIHSGSFIAIPPFSQPTKFVSQKAWK